MFPPISLHILHVGSEDTQICADVICSRSPNIIMGEPRKLNLNLVANN